MKNSCKIFENRKLGVGVPNTADIYLLKVNKKISRTMCEICSK